MIENITGNFAFHNLNVIYGKKTISYFVRKPRDDNLLYYGQNE